MQTFVGMSFGIGKCAHTELRGVANVYELDGVELPSGGIIRSLS